MNYEKRFALASSGAALVLLLYTAAAQLPSLTRADHVALLVLVLAAMARACLGVFLRNRKRSAVT
ncbi:MAG: hypothetical protein ACK4FW_11550 [Stenotrophomonas sp.]